MAAQLAEDRRHRVSLERRPNARVVASQGMEQPDASDLNQVVARLAGVGVAARKLADQRQMALDELSMRMLVAAATPEVEEVRLGFGVETGRVHERTRAAESRRVVVRRAPVPPTSPMRPLLPERFIRVRAGARLSLS